MGNSISLEEKEYSKKFALRKPGQNDQAINECNKVIEKYCGNTFLQDKRIYCFQYFSNRLCSGHAAFG